ncbi:fluoride efflux transporter CrcB [Sphingomonas changnyeongensis]|uniref:Fluoride-specific ion channel FluC n=1 Tax=Sphingomonas changnyeongensis TaxID=2698679 RepID=A0A7Z2S4H4_9SPHN|nr:fluoride efflux transporter CrcB [Sphingomonas changnyeongensis]QHL90090.1 fluoride efflux transporter CrcB [Sphingomonas changnyeongensis]
MNSLFLVMIGGALGAAARFQLGGWAARVFWSGLPWGTLIVNVTGALAMGLVAALAARGLGESGLSEGWRLFLGVGLLGGFTTFSAFSLETVMLIERGAFGWAAAYVAASVVGALAALWLGLRLGQPA